jgi:hypothetical protein
MVEQKTMTVLHSKFMPPILGFMLALAFIQLSPNLWSWWRTTGRAIEWIGVTVHTPVVRPGGTLKLTYRAIVNRSCPADLRSFIIAPDNTFPVRFPTVRGGYTAPSNGEIVEIEVAVVVPMQPDPGLAPFVSGPHIYRTASTRYCPYGVEDDHFVPDARFQLEVP